jgi:hypothetical protein
LTEYVGGILELPETGIAPAAEESAYLACGVVMVDVQLLPL